MNMNSDNKILLKVARQFHEKNMSKTDIAKDLMVSVTHVNRLLSEAKIKGIVKCHIEAPHFEDLEVKLAEKFNLLEAKVIAYTADEDYLRLDLGHAAAEYFETHVKDNQSVGIGSGKTVYQMVSQIKEKTRKIKLYPINIIAQRELQVNSLSANSLVNNLWFKSRPESNAFKVELFYPHKSISETMQEIQDLTKNGHVEEFHKDINDLDFYFLSIGNLRENSVWVSLANEVGLTFKQIQEKNIIGDCIFNTINNKGNYVSCGLEELRLGLNLEELSDLANKRKKTIVCISGGINKIEVLRATLLRRIFNVIITDHETARALLES